MEDAKIKAGLAERLKEIRKDRGLSQQELADALGLAHKSSISKIEKGKRGISIPYVLRLADALHVDPAYLLFGKGSKE